jgi:ATP-binding cassette subfamily B protein
MIGDYDINYISNYSLRNLVSVVPQHIDLFSGNVIENIALGEDIPDIQRIIDITKNLGILEFIEKLPNGFQLSHIETFYLIDKLFATKIAIKRGFPHILFLKEKNKQKEKKRIRLLYIPKE